ncbi:aspartic peptidase domain-containing protein [Suillus bovinus]|uniref:aspartic peptidase domain-containing protein n=1 Tax=Suillus bovinus TaxID=48563 RepID=UPI001B86422B|nr:aspartic peptidase domain-containing protein [Suillus bovinus]KAG2130765.1 aspartic peptidase domain-containing protein [Suillus bovinus]
MFPTVSLLTTILLAFSITVSSVEVSNSPITLPIARRLNVSDGIINLLQRDKARMAALRDSSLSHAGLGTSISNVGNSYLLAVGVGSPPKTYNLIVDTGSSNTWIGAGTPYVKTKTSVNTGRAVSVGYGSGFFSGTEYLDTVTLGQGLTIPHQSIGVASSSSGFAGVDGILGMGPVDLTLDTLTKEPKTTIPTVTDSLHSQGTIQREVFSISFEPTNSQPVTNGELTFGETDAHKYTGAITYTPITTGQTASNYWGIKESISYGSTTIMSSTDGIVDTGTTFIFIATDAYKKYKSATGGIPDSATGLLRVSSSQYKALKNLNFHIGGETYTLTPNAQLWPRALNTYIGGASKAMYLVVSDIDSANGPGFDFVNGYPFLERFYSVFDATNSRIGFATTAYTNSEIN